MTNLRVAVDIGGTFTDICILDEDSGALRVAKTASTPDDPLIGAMRGLEEASVALKDVTLFSHGTTVATNALITRRLPPAAMICTEGYRDVIEIRRSNKEDLWDTYNDVAQPYIRRRDRLTVRERIDHGGKVTVPLDEADAREKARILRKRGVHAVAVCFMNSFINPQHEVRVKEILQEELPGVEITTSSETLPEIFEHERFSTTVVNAILSPVVGGYVSRMNDALQKGGYASDLLMLHSGGGVMTPATAGQFAGRLAGSGIAAGAIASRHIAMLCGYENSIGLDMGGTSCDVSLVFGGESRVTKDWHIEFGYPIRFPSIEVLTIGAGGGSLAWIDDAGSLHNGPQSAGADPGPACYGRGNTTPTNTDANLALGRLGTSLAGGQIELDKAASETAVRTGVAEPLGMDATAAAKAIVSVANANMADAVRLISISRGYDPRDFALVAFGGAGCAARRGAGQGAVHPHRDRAAQPGGDLCARLPARGRAPRPLADLPRARGRRRPRRYRGPIRRDGGGGAQPAGEGGRGGVRHAPAAHDRHDVHGPVALAPGAGGLALHLGAGCGGRLPRRPRPGIRLPPGRHAGRAFPPQSRGHRHGVQGRADASCGGGRQGGGSGVAPGRLRRG